MSRAVRCVLPLALLLAAAPCFAAELTLTAPKAEAPAGEESTFAIQASVGVETSALQGGLSYDPALVEVLGVSAGSALPDGARADFNADQPGWLRLGFVCSPSKPSFKGAGEVLLVRVRAKGAVGAEGALKLAQVRAWEPNDTEHLVVVAHGTLRIIEAKGLPWLPIGAGVVFLLLLLLAATRRRRKEPVEPAPTRAAPRSAPAPSGARGRFCTSCGAAIPKPGARFCGECGAQLA